MFETRPTFGQRLWRFVKRLTLLTLIMVALPFTPLFSHLGVGAMTAFSYLALPARNDTPQSIVVLGGGLTRKRVQGSRPIILNHYSQARAATAHTLHQETGLPIITSGAESPWLQDYFREMDNDTFIISDNASMNTCENAVFTAKLLEYHELPKSVYLVTDRYHMARARRQFAKAGVETYAHAAPLAIALDWLNPKNNLTHSRRTAYEIIALARDIFRPQNNCRGSDKITIEEISTPRRKAKTFG